MTRVERDGKFSQVLRGVDVEVSLVGNAEPHMRLVPSRYALIVVPGNDVTERAVTGECDSLPEVLGRVVYGSDRPNPY